jgi:hypothetical protein
MCILLLAAMLISRSGKGFWEWGVGFASAERGWDVGEWPLRRGMGFFDN